MTIRIKFLIVSLLMVLPVSAAQAAFITPINVTTPNTVASNAVPQNIINHNGLNTAGEHTEAFLTQNHWRTADAANTLSVTFDLGARFDLDQMRVWNYNEVSGTSRGVRDMDVSFSNDNLNFTQPHAVTLSEATGVPTYSGEDHNFNLNQGYRYVKFNVSTSHGSSGGLTGLSEVRFNTTTAEITPASVSVNQYANGGAVFAPVNMINDRGMVGFGNEQSDSVTAASNDGMWRQKIQDGNTVAASVINFDLGSDHAIGAIKVWNYHEEFSNVFYNERGVAEFDLYQSDDDVNYSFVGTFSLDEQLEQLQSVKHNVIDLNGQNVDARYLEFRLKTNHGGNYYGLNEVRFYAPAIIPEPGSLMLTLAGVSMLLKRRNPLTK